MAGRVANLDVRYPNGRTLSGERSMEKRPEFLWREHHLYTAQRYSCAVDDTQHILLSPQMTDRPLECRVCATRSKADGLWPVGLTLKVRHGIRIDTLVSCCPAGVGSHAGPTSRGIAAMHHYYNLKGAL